MAGLRAEKFLPCRNLAIDRYDSFYILICSAFELKMFYEGGVRKQTDSQAAQVKTFSAFKPAIVDY